MLVRVVIALVGFLALSACSPQGTQDEGPRFVQVEVGALTSDRYNTGGVSWADANGDGILDAVVANGYNVAAGEPYKAQENRIYLGTAAGGFEVAETNGLTDAPQFSSGTAWADVDGDGLADVLIANQRDQDNALYLARRGEDGTLSYEHTPAGELSSDGGWSYAAGFADVDSDGLLDAFVSEGGLSHEGPNRLYRNLGGGRFERVTDTELSRLSQGTGAAVWADYDNDGDSDLFTASRTAGDGIPLALYRNDGNLLFTRMEGIGLVSDFRPVITAAWADVDNDLNLDLYVGGMSGFSGGLYINNGDGTFRLREDDPLSTTAANAYGAAFGDYDNYGDQDLMVAHWGGGTMLFQNDGTGR
ncbi:MAG: VCBS repeat-containing protein, partial [Acidobacteriota bacterium]